MISDYSKWAKIEDQDESDENTLEGNGSTEAIVSQIGATKIAADNMLNEALKLDSVDMLNRSITAYGEVRRLVANLGLSTPMSQFTYDMDVSCVLNMSCCFLKLFDWENAIIFGRLARSSTHAFSSQPVNHIRACYFIAFASVELFQKAHTNTRGIAEHSTGMAVVSNSNCCSNNCACSKAREIACNEVEALRDILKRYPTVSVKMQMDDYKSLFTRFESLLSLSCTTISTSTSISSPPSRNSNRVGQLQEQGNKNNNNNNTSDVEDHSATAAKYDANDSVTTTKSRSNSEGGEDNSSLSTQQEGELLSLGLKYYENREYFKSLQVYHKAVFGYLERPDDDPIEKKSDVTSCSKRSDRGKQFLQDLLILTKKNKAFSTAAARLDCERAVAAFWGWAASSIRHTLATHRLLLQSDGTGLSGNPNASTGDGSNCYQYRNSIDTGIACQNTVETLLLCLQFIEPSTAWYAMEISCQYKNCARKSEVGQQQQQQARNGEKKEHEYEFTLLCSNAAQTARMLVRSFECCTDWLAFCKEWTSCDLLTDRLIEICSHCINIPMNMNMGGHNMGIHTDLVDSSGVDKRESVFLFLTVLRAGRAAAFMSKGTLYRDKAEAIGGLQSANYLDHVHRPPVVATVSDTATDIMPPLRSSSSSSSSPSSSSLASLRRPEITVTDMIAALRRQSLPDVPKHPTSTSVFLDGDYNSAPMKSSYRSVGVGGIYSSHGSTYQFAADVVHTVVFESLGEAVAAYFGAAGSEFCADVKSEATYRHGISAYTELAEYWTSQCGVVPFEQLINPQASHRSTTNLTTGTTGGAGGKQALYSAADCAFSAWKLVSHHVNMLLERVAEGQQCGRSSSDETSVSHTTKGQRMVLQKLRVQHVDALYNAGLCALMMDDDSSCLGTTDVVRQETESSTSSSELAKRMFEAAQHSARLVNCEQLVLLSRQNSSLRTSIFSTCGDSSKDNLDQRSFSTLLADISIHLGHAYTRCGMFKEAITEGERAFDQLRLPLHDLRMVDTINANYSAGGTAKSVAKAAGLGDVSASNRLRRRHALSVLVLAHSARGDTKEAEGIYKRYAEACLGPVESAQDEAARAKQLVSAQLKHHRSNSNIDKKTIGGSNGRGATFSSNNPIKCQKTAAGDQPRVLAASVPAPLDADKTNDGQDINEQHNNNFQRSGDNPDVWNLRIAYCILIAFASIVTAIIVSLLA